MPGQRSLFAAFAVLGRSSSTSPVSGRVVPGVKPHTASCCYPSVRAGALREHRLLSTGGLAARLIRSGSHRGNQSRPRRRARTRLRDGSRLPRHRPQRPNSAVTVLYWRLPGAIGLPSCSRVAARLSLALYLAAAGPSAKARSTLVVTWRTNAGGRAADAVRLVAVDRLHPAHRATVEDPGAARVGVVGRVAVAGDAPAGQRGVGEHLDRALERVGGVDPVVLDADQVREGPPR